MKLPIPKSRLLHSWGSATALSIYTTYLNENEQN